VAGGEHDRDGAAVHGRHVAIVEDPGEHDPLRCRRGAHGAQRRRAARPVADRSDEHQVQVAIVARQGVEHLMRSGSRLRSSAPPGCSR
jgi:hypothetical protein